MLNAYQVLKIKILDSDVAEADAEKQNIMNAIPEAKLH
jgi:hypothetical protein